MAPDQSPAHALAGAADFIPGREEQGGSRGWESQASPYGHFPVTPWSVVSRAQAAAGTAAHEALTELCKIYWYPLYAFARRNGFPFHEAEDVTQGFFAQLLNRRLFERADANRGKLRSFLLTSFKRYIRDRRDHVNASAAGIANTSRSRSSRRNGGTAESLSTS